MEILYYRLKSSPGYLDKVIEFSKNVSWKWVPFMNISLEFQRNLGLQITENDTMLSDLKNKFNGTLRLYMFAKNSVYNWHRDVDMGCSLNLIFDDYKSFTLFNPSDKKEIVDSVTELKYQKNYWYLFNSQILHSVVNLDTKDRILLTFTFPKNVNYSDVLDFIKQKEY
jgi:hypothetical protein